MVQGEDGQVHILIEQRGCNRLTIVRRTGYLGKVTPEKHVLELDGIARDDSGWFAGPGRYKTSAKFDGAILHVEARSDNGVLVMNYSSTAESDLLEDVLLNERRLGGPVVAKRQK